jgi:O-antigen ligase
VNQEVSLTEPEQNQFSKSAILVLVLIIAISISPRILVGTLSYGRALELRYEDILIIIVAYVWLLALFSHRKIITKTPISKTLHLYVFFAIISTFLGIFMGWIDLSRASFFFFKEIEYFFLFFLVVNMVKTRKDIYVVLWTLVVLGFTNNIYGLVQISTRQFYGGYGIALIGEGSPFSAGGYYTIILFLSIVLLTYGENRNMFLRIGLVTNAFLCLINLTFSVSRAFILSAIVAFVLFLFLRKEKRFLPYVITIIAILMIVIINQPIGRFLERNTLIRTRLSGEAIEGGINARIELAYQPALNKLKANPILGLGKSIFGTGDMPTEAHNAFLRVLVEMGIIGLFVFILLIFLIMKTAWTSYGNTSNNTLKAVALTCFLVTVALLIAALVQDSFTPVKVSEIYWIIVGLTMVAFRIEMQDASSSTHPSRTTRSSPVPLNQSSIGVRS